MPAPLTLWLHRRAIGQVEQLRNRNLRLRYEPDVVRDFGIGSCPLSLSLPLTTKRVEGPVLERWLDNLLPESFVRAALERQHGIRPGDTFALLHVIGQECAGAVQFTSGNQPLGSGTLRELSPGEVDRIVRDLPTIDLPDGLTIGASLGGIQAKVLLTRTRTGWAWPTEGAMSTHIVKPEPTSDVVVPDLVRYEEWAMRLAARAGLPAARAEVADFGGRTAIVVERYDRVRGARDHQEDFAQALGVAARDKYESTEPGPGRLARIAELAGAQAADPAALRRDLLRLVAFNLTIGNGDAHSKNYSLRIDEDAQFALAPLYDAAPVYLINDRLAHFGHALDGQTRLPHLTAGHLVDEAESWGMRRDRASRIVIELLEAVAVAARETESLPGRVDIAAAVHDRATLLAEGIGPGTARSAR